MIFGIETEHLQQDLGHGSFTAAIVTFCSTVTDRKLERQACLRPVGDGRAESHYSAETSFLVKLVRRVC